MQKSFLFILSLMLLLNTAAPLFAEQNEVVVLNRTGYDIYYLYLSPESSDSWGDDLLGEEILSDGNHVTVSVPGMGKSCVFDLQAVDLDDDSYIKWGLNLCDTKKVIITIEDYVSDTDADTEGSIQDFSLVNNTGFTVWHIYVSPDYSENWEEDLLGEDEVLEEGESFPITFTGYEDHCYFDIKIVDSEGDEYTKYGVDLCSLYEVVFTLDDISY